MIIFAFIAAYIGFQSEQSQIGCLSLYPDETFES